MTRPVVRLVGYARTALDPGDVELRVARSANDTHAALALRLVGAEREVDHHRRLTSAVRVSRATTPTTQKEATIA